MSNGCLSQLYDITDSIIKSLTQTGFGTFNALLTKRGLYSFIRQSAEICDFVLVPYSYTTYGIQFDLCYHESGHKHKYMCRFAAHMVVVNKCLQFCLHNLTKNCREIYIPI